MWKSNGGFPSSSCGQPGENPWGFPHQPGQRWERCQQKFGGEASSAARRNAEFWGIPLANINTHRSGVIIISSLWEILVTSQFLGGQQRVLNTAILISILIDIE
jgi:hypothetical protein